MSIIAYILIAMVSGAFAGVMAAAFMEAYFQRRSSDQIYSTEFHPDEPLPEEYPTDVDSTEPTNEEKT